MQAYVPELKGSNFELSEPELYPDVGIWHPLAPAMYEDLKEYLNWCAPLGILIRPSTVDCRTCMMYIRHKVHDGRLPG